MQNLTMPNSNQTGWKKIAGALGAVVLAAAGAYFGIDTSSNSDSTSAKSSEASGTATPSTASGSESKNAPKPSASNKNGSKKAAKSGECAVDTLPPEADDVINRILSDQDHLYSQHDGKHFGNYQNRLPREKSDYYREYTVKTPGDRSRGARRIVVGGGTENDPDVWYYTPDHYDSFCVIPDAED